MMLFNNQSKPIAMMKTDFRTILSCLSILIFSLFLFQSCKDENRAEPMPMTVNEYVYAHTSGVISRAAPIRVRFASPVIEREMAGKEAELGLISFTPILRGTAIWEDVSTLLFKPEENLKSATPYVATVALKDIFSDIPSDARVFQFDFKTREQGFQVDIDGLAAASANNLKEQELKGTVNTFDVADNQEVEEVLKAKQGGKDLEIEWEHLSGQEHQFRVKNINRKPDVSKLNLSWNGKAIFVKNTGQREIEVPALGDFKVLDAKVIRSGRTPAIQLNFSDPLLQNQNLEGLIRLQNFKGSLDFTINGSQVLVYPKGNLTGQKTVEVSPGVKNSQSAKMQKPSVWTVQINQVRPQVRLVREGVIMPNASGLVLPFEAVSLNAVEVEVFKIFDNNILQFLQTNHLNGNQDLHRVGRVILQEKVPLKNLNPQASSFSWEQYALDLSQLFQADPKAIYQIRIGFRPEYSTYACGNTTENPEPTFANNNLNEDGEIKSFWGSWYGINGRYDGYEWSHRDDPCQPAYFNYDRFVRTNVVSSDLGIMAKAGTQKNYFVAVTNLMSTTPVAEVKLSFYDFQQQLIRETKTDAGGIAEVNLDKKPFAIIAENGLQKGYLKLGDGNSLSLSRYDVSGAVAQKGMKGFIYGERGVWRPGDSLYLNFILESKAKQLPENHPVTFELRDPRGQIFNKQLLTQKVKNVYPIHIQTNQDSPTGNWMAKVKAGGATFTKVLKIETVKPNRLKIDLDFGKEELSVADMPANVSMQVNWLHGAPAQNLETKVEMQVTESNTTFNNLNQYEFDDPARKLYANPATIFDGNVDANGAANFNLNSIIRNGSAPGKLMAKVKSRAFEKGGDFSTFNTSIAYSPYKNYAGVSLPKDKNNEQRIGVNKNGNINFILVDDKGNPLKNKELDVGLYRVNWRWWWDRGRENVSRFNHSNHNNAQQTIKLTTNENGEASWSVKPNRWGRYLVRVCDSEGGHCSGDYFYAGYPWYEQSGGVNRSEAAMMAFSADKEKYKVGEDIELKIPASDDSRMLVTLENGTKVLDSFWGEAKKGENPIRFRATEAMAPTVYAHVTLIQPHGQVENDLPIRMYGVLPISIENPKTILQPKLKMPDELAPKQKFTVKVSEENGEAMAYTIAVVDDGLLDLTNFKTPAPHSSFYAREALGVKTWDVYDYVLGAYGGELERVLSIGGDGELAAGAEKKNANRFKPVVRHLGPFYLKKGKTAKHEITMPNYVGSVRTMVVAANENAAYGHIEKTTPVRKPLMLLATLPRVLGPGETLKMPISLFAMDEKVKNVTVSVEETSGLVNFKEGKSQTLNFAKMGEKMTYFNIEVGENVGIAKFKITAKGGGETATQEIEMDVRNPNPFVTNIDSKMLAAGETWAQDFAPVGLRGTNSGILEVSNIPPINLGKRLNYLIRYPHGCIEQTTSTGFPQLFVENLLELSPSQKEQIPQNIQATVNRLSKFQTADGGFAYWPGNEDPSAWGSNYGGHFMLEAKERGYILPLGMLDNWVTFQKNRARQWQREAGGFRDHGIYNSKDLMQAYRLYTLAKAGQPELGAMNRMREMDNLSLQAKWRLAAAYALVGKPNVAKEVFNKLPTTIEPYQELGRSYGSNHRDLAMILETLVLCGEDTKAAPLMEDLAKALNSQRWFSTQTTAYSLMAIAKYVGKNASDEKMNFEVQIGGGQIVNAGSETPVMQIEIPVDDLNAHKIFIKNTTEGKLFAKLILTGKPLIGDQTAKEENLKIAVTYKTANGERLNPEKIGQGTDFIAEISVTNPGSRAIDYEEMALSQIFPSGWEIINSRLDGFGDFSNTTRPEYQDIRDDRVYTYFDIRRNKTHVYRVQLNAAYQGRYYLPTVSCEAMYDNTINARVPGTWVEVLAADEI